MSSKFFCLIICILLMISLGGCSKEESTFVTPTERTETEETVQLVEISEPAEEMVFNKVVVGDETCIEWCQTQIPVALGYPELPEDGSVSNTPTNYADALANLRSKYSKETINSADTVRQMAYYLKNSYQEIGVIRLNCTEGADPYELMFIREAGTYYLMDPYNALDQEDSWLSGFAGTTGYGDDLTDLCEELVLHSGAEYDTWEFNTLFCQTEIYIYNKIEIPVGTGKPQLSDPEIDALLESDDYAYIAEQITTLADCLNYYIRGDFVFGDGLIKNQPTTCSAHQTMQRRVGQCASMSSCTNYLLWGDYDEVGYISLSGHIMTYIKQDGVYYAINPAYYMRDENYESTGEQNLYKYDPETINSSASDFQFIADGLVRDFSTEYVFTYSWPYSYMGADPYNPRYPEECNAISWTGQKISDCSYNQKLYENDTFVDEKEIVMYQRDMAPIYGYYYVRENLPYYRGW